MQDSLKERESKSNTSAFACAMLYHNYYSMDGVEELRGKINALKGTNILFLCSLPAKFAEEMPSQTEKEKFVISANTGKDIGGKMLLIQLLLRLHPEIPYVIFLHDKRSYQKHSGAFEKEQLFSIINPGNFEKIVTAFEQTPKMGIACSKGSLRNEYMGEDGFKTSNSELLNDLMNKYDIHPTDYHFVAGTMFWMRTSILKGFFGKFQPLQIRSTLEEGNVLDHDKGTITHSWERMLSWIATARGYKIKEF
jgi:lipopolysaccharide biosynthesis protein